MAKNFTPIKKSNPKHLNDINLKAVTDNCMRDK